MSKNKTKRARREAKREESRKLAAYRRKTTAAVKPSSKLPAPSSKRQKLHPANTNNKPVQQASQRRVVPFGTYDNILLVGEGDFSFARSLAIEHGCANLTATSFDTEEEVREKYPSFEAVEEELGRLTPPVPLVHGIDAAKLRGYKSLRTEEPWDTIAFQFPHTGGLSTDVNRQVRANQALLVSFFKACLSQNKPSHKAPAREFLKIGGRVIVTLFEGPPYTLWNVRDLARHSGLKVVESFKFDWADYPGYKHVRTLGALEGGGAWKGEDREARMYIFEKVAGESSEGEKRGEEAKARGKKRGREESDGDDDSED
ncbi:hypothetical protein BU26DRAFT_538616 [Trematosphaeria pertusa]|uniref:25S rRNA (uridine-N(3))-methyltransferase BMT5-like domain-containing protein n=1 Tax=Trematosphaeria pertusa TaxID=390896 RepID=A0A6A6IV71_9PLEO|nr:uncharacterized protein BU26DRAFT_538616 [Trematosphaeria pertusa]KAF2254128.1 hypothetical protein BU26DRAFT_538616 [Trematosphaeria pertusa]